MVKTKRAKSISTVSIISAITSILLSAVTHLVAEPLKNKMDAFSSAETAYLQHVETSTNSLKLDQLLINQDNYLSQKPKTEQKSDYSNEIGEEKKIIADLRSGLDVDSEAVSRLVDSLPSHANVFTDAVGSLKETVQKIEKTLDDVLNSTAPNDQTRLLKIGMGVMAVGGAQIQVLKVGNDVLQEGREELQPIKKLYGRCENVEYVLFLIAALAAICGLATKSCSGHTED